MAKAMFHSLRGEKSALIMIKANQFIFGASPAYIPKAALPEGIKENEFFDIPDGYKLVPFVDFESGQIRTTKDGQQLHCLAY